jgi:hypothetical protein
MQRFNGPRLPDGSKAGFFLGDGAGVHPRCVYRRLLHAPFAPFASWLLLSLLCVSRDEA